MQGLHFDVDAFCSWLCSHEHEVVGYAGKWFDTPLARWLSEMTGYLYGIDDKLYGRATSDSRCWHLLPCWAEVFSVWLESYSYRALTGDEALDVLAQVELVFSSVGGWKSCRAAA